jgi:hypothetical protein
MHRTRKQRHPAQQCSLLLGHFIRSNPGKSPAIFFLNCTKNTELTRARFARTVSFAFIKNLSRPTPDKPAGGRFQNFTQKDSYSGPRHMKSEQWKTYRTRFLVKAKQLSSSLSFVDHLGRQHCGRKGDYLVESSDGVLSIAPRRIFEDIYVSMSLSRDPGIAEPLLTETSLTESSLTERAVAEKTIRDSKPERLKFEPLEIEEVRLEEAELEPLNLKRAKLDRVKLGKPPVSSRRVDDHLISRPDNVREDAPARARRKLPQPCGERRVSTPRLHLM